ncbi:MAG: glycoside hydrolase family 99-like domain-containing protein [Gammaproteobacteria bacterium]|nr:glycoside hydrolase family 99-like domain-containing protein [Gammaproteobacteria bacterium]MBU1409126.1 glycoside hydrolase family 99-like domain-containing protein [Gammaproteobacteria bacterium]MBU1531022.1 glycoside hydrolase family 99-like domain-containing protein [Gammaproteobacteria bacterium]
MTETPNTNESLVRAIAFYLPQFHPIPENDEWWGKGFTEWRNVAKAQPLFPGHYQPHLPADLGFYDLRLPEVREAQAELARQYGIHGFCYYHYWFNGRRILERPFDEVLESGKPDFPFCLCWANENWTRVWDGGENDVLLDQNYSHEDDRAHIQSLLPAFADERYIRVNGKPLFLVYRTGLLPDPKKTADIWREEARKAGFDDLYLVRVESHGDTTGPTTIGFDASVEFAPFNGLTMHPEGKTRTGRLLASIPFLKPAFVLQNIYDYRRVAMSMWQRADSAYKLFHSVTPGWDNTARRKVNATILANSSPSIYKQWLTTMVARTLGKFQGDERLVFINAWNEWAEGNHLEPCAKWGHAYLEATRTALASEMTTKTAPPLATSEAAPRQRNFSPRNIYWRLLTRFNGFRRLLGYVRLPCTTYWRQK